MIPFDRKLFWLTAWKAQLQESTAGVFGSGPTGIVSHRVVQER